MDNNENEQEQKKRNITEWAMEDRPRERLMGVGAHQLSVPELLAILIGSGNRHETAVALMQRIYDDCSHSLKRLGKMRVDELCDYEGIGEAKAVSILAACELGARRQGEDYAQVQITRSSDIYRYFRPLMQDLAWEECYVLLLNQAHRVLGRRLISKGGIAGTSVDVRQVLKEALLAQAPAIVLVHNHPSGSTRPSVDDDRLTKRVSEAAKTMNIRLLDHVVVADGSYYSYSDNGKLSNPASG